MLKDPLEPKWDFLLDSFKRIDGEVEWEELPHWVIHVNCCPTLVPPKTISCGTTEAPPEPSSPPWGAGDQGPWGPAGHTCQPGQPWALRLPGPPLSSSPRDSDLTLWAQIWSHFLWPAVPGLPSTSEHVGFKKKKKERKPTSDFLGDTRIILILYYCSYLIPRTRLYHAEVVSAVSQSCVGFDRTGLLIILTSTLCKKYILYCNPVDNM